MQYELFYLVGESNEPNLEKIKEKMDGILKEENCALLEPLVSRKRKMAYAIEKENRGTYIARRFEAPENDGSAEEKNIIKDITHKINSGKEVLRFIIIKADELPPLKSEEARGPVARAREKPRMEAVKKERTSEKPEEIDQKLEEIFNI